MLALPPRCRVAPRLAWLSLPLAVACSTPITSAPDAGAPVDAVAPADSRAGDATKDGAKRDAEGGGQKDAGGHDSPPRDASPTDGTRLDASADAPRSGDAPADVGPATDAGPDAHPDAALPTTLLLVGVTSGSTLATLGAHYATSTGSWSAMTSLGTTNVQPFNGLDVVVDEAGVGIAVVLSQGSTGGIEAAAWSSGAGWGTLVTTGTSAALLGTLIRTSSGEALVYVNGQDVYYESEVGTSLQPPQEIAGIEAANQSAPAMALTLDGDLVVVAQNETQEFVWSERTGTTWSTPASVPNVGEMSPNLASVALASRIGEGQIVATFVSGQMSGTTGTSLQASTFTGGVWSSPVTLTTAVETNKAPAVLLAALADGRVALVCWTTAGVEVAFFSGSGATASWGALSVIPGVAIGDVGEPVQASLSIAPGVGSDILELVFIDGNMALEHTRLLSSGTWSTPISVDSTRTYEAVAIASGP